MNKKLNRIVIVGRDADAWITALTLKQSFAQVADAPEVFLVELSPELSPVDFYAVMPAHKVLHKVLGANERSLLKESGGHFCFGQRFSNWCGGSDPYLHAYDRFGLDFNGIEFYQYWLKAVQNGLQVKLEDFSLGAVAAKHQKYIVFNEKDTTFSQASCGYHLSAIDYVKSVARAAVGTGVKHLKGMVANVSVGAGKITSIKLATGQEVDGDLFIDASGVEAILIKELENDNIEKWNHWLPANHIMVASAPAMKELSSYSQISAFKEGWFGIYPMLKRTGINFVYNADYIKPQNLLELASAFTGLTIDDVVDTPFSSGTRKKHWIGNCIAIGSTAVSLEPLDAVQLHPLHIGLSLLNSLMPVSAETMPEADIYNRKMTSFIENVRDYQIAHYYLNRRYGDQYWDKLRGMDIPDSLKMKIELFKENGMISLNENETFLQENWISLFVGQQLQAARYNPAVDQLSDQDLIANFQKLLSHIKSQVEHMPNMQAYVEMNLI